MKKFEIFYMTNDDPETVNDSIMVEGDFIEMRGREANVMKFGDDSEPYQSAWVRNVVLWREIVET